MSLNRNNQPYRYELNMVNGEVSEPMLTVDNYQAIENTIKEAQQLRNDTHARNKLNALLQKVLFRWFVFKTTYRENLDDFQLNSIEEALSYQGTIAIKLMGFYNALSTTFVKDHTRTKDLENLFNNCVPATNAQEYNRLKQAYEKETQAKKIKKPTNNTSENFGSSDLQEICALLQNDLQLLQENDSSSSRIHTIEDDAAAQKPLILGNKELKKLKEDLELAKKSLQDFYSRHQEELEDAKACDYDASMRNHARYFVKKIERLQNIAAQEQSELIANQWKQLAQKICYLNVYKGLHTEITRLNNDYSLEKDESIKKIITARQESIKAAIEKFNSFLTADNQNNTYAEAKDILTTLQTQMVSTGRKNPTLRGSSGLNFFGFSTVTGKNKIKALIKSIEKEEGIDAPPKKSLFSFTSS